MAILDPRLQVYLNLLPTVNDITQVKPYVNNVLEVASGKLSTFIDEVAHSDHPLKKNIISTFIDEVAHSDHPLKTPALLRPKLRI